MDPRSDKPPPDGVIDPLIHKHRKHRKLSKQKVTVYLDPRLVKAGEKSADRHGYIDGIHGLIEGHLLLGLIWDSANPDKKHSHTVDVINDAESFEREIQDILTNPPKDWGSWMARLVERAQQRNQEPPPE